MAGVKVMVDVVAPPPSTEPESNRRAGLDVKQEDGFCESETGEPKLPLRTQHCG